MSLSVYSAKTTYMAWWESTLPQCFLEIIQIGLQLCINYLCNQILFTCTLCLRT